MSRRSRSSAQAGKSLIALIASSISPTAGNKASAGASRSFADAATVQQGHRGQVKDAHRPAPTPDRHRWRARPRSHGLLRALQTPRRSGPVHRDWPGPRASGGNASGADKISPIPRMIRGRGSRQTGTSAPVARAAAATRSSFVGRSFKRASSRNAAAASDDPPPMPAATGSRLVRWKCPARRLLVCACNARAALSTRLPSSGRLPRRFRRHGQGGRIARHEQNVVADIRKHHEAFEFMIAVGAPAADPQRQVDLGRSEFRELRRRPARSGSRPGQPPLSDLVSVRRSRRGRRPAYRSSACPESFAVRRAPASAPPRATTGNVPRADARLSNRRRRDDR